MQEKLKKLIDKHGLSTKSLKLNPNNKAYSIRIIQGDNKQTISFYDKRILFNKTDMLVDPKIAESLYKHASALHRDFTKMENANNAAARAREKANAFKILLDSVDD